MRQLDRIELLLLRALNAEGAIFRKEGYIMSALSDAVARIKADIDNAIAVLQQPNADVDAAVTALSAASDKLEAVVPAVHAAAPTAAAPPAV